MKYSYLSTVCFFASVFFSAASQADLVFKNSFESFVNPATPLVPGSHLPLDSDNGFLVTEGSLWEWGPPSTGPLKGHLGINAWATDLYSYYYANAREYLYLPRLDLSTTIDPTFSFRLWSRFFSNDGLSLEIREEGKDWVALLPDTPIYESTDATGASAWGSHGYQRNYVFAAVNLSAYVGSQVDIRFSVRTNCCLENDGAFLDEFRLDEEGVDVDEDGLVGVLNEYHVSGTDPYLSDSDDDGALDGEEMSAGTDPLVGADYPGGPVWSQGFSSDLESDAAELWTDSILWEWGPPQYGPCDGSCQANSPIRVWATNLDGVYFPGAIEYLYLPPIDLSAAISPSLNFFAWCSSTGNSGLSLEVRNPDGSWSNLTTVDPAYSIIDPSGFPAWGNLGSGTTYEPVSVNLSDWANEKILLRLSYRTATVGSSAAGCYLDDFSLN
jgi:hypothetical protein